MKHVRPTLRSVPSASADVIVLSCPDQPHFDPAPLVRLFDKADPHRAEDTMCRMLEDIAGQLDLLQSGLAARDFDAMRRPSRRVEMVACHLGLIEVGVAAAHVVQCIAQRDGVALDATMARLERGFDVAVSEVWNFREM